MLSRSAAWRQTLRAGRRRITTNSVEKETGHLDTGADEAILFFDNVFPIQYGIFDIRKWLVKLDTGMAERVLRNAIPKDLGVQLASMTPRVKEGGALLRVRWDKLSGLTPQTVAARIDEHLSKDHQHLYFNPLRRLRSFLVRGRPWIEDLHRFPSQRLKVEFEGPELSQETLYEHFRRYGKIINIFPASATQKYAILQFAQIRSATAARTCLHGYRDGMTTLKIGFESQLKAHIIKDWLVNHPRFTVPAFAALAAGLSATLFEPIRTWFVEQTISRAFHYEDTKLFKWLKSGAYSLIPRRLRRQKQEASWFEREETKKEIRTWLDESISSFSIVQGPRGTGKRELVVNDVLKDRKNVFVLDCESLVDSRSDAGTISNLATQFGYRPIFSWMNSISSLVDLAAQGMTGQSTGFSETLDSQLKKIFGTATTALKKIALKHRGKEEMRDEEYLEAHPTERPVVVIDKFLYKAENAALVYENIAKFAATLTESNIAHVIILTTDVGYSKVLQKALPDKLFNSVTLGDASPQMALQYVERKVTESAQDIHQHGDMEPQVETPFAKIRNDVQSQLHVLGGRLTDLDFYSRRLLAGEEPKVAADSIINQSANEIIKLYFSPNEQWNRLQAWHLLCRITATPNDVRYQELLLDPVFKEGGHDALKALEQAEMISITTKNGRPYSVRAARPVYKAAFQRLLEDTVFCASLELERLNALLAAESSGISKIENELTLLKDISTKKISGRVEYLLDKLESAQKKIVEMESNAGNYKLILQREY